MQRGDAVLDVTQIARWAGCIGNRSTIVPVADAKHDVFLSLQRAAGRSPIGELDRWLDGYLSAATTPTPRHRSERGDGVETYDVAIIGTGSGNSILDDRHADKRVALCEQGTFGGTCLNVGCIPTKMFVYAAEVAQTIRDAARYGVDAHIDRVRWDDIVSRVFGRIDPIGLSGEDYRSSAPNTDLYKQHTRFGPVQADGRYLLRTDAGEEFTADQVVIAAGSRPTVPPAILESGARLPHQRHHHANRRVARASGDRRKWLRGSRIRAHLLRARRRGSPWWSAAPRCCGTTTTPSANGSPASPRANGNCAPTATSWAPPTATRASHSSSTTARTLNADLLLVATGRLSNADLLDAEQAGVDVEDGRVVVDEYQRTSARGVFALGDVSSPYQLKHVANHEARVVQHNLLCDWDDTESMTVTDHRFVPSAVFTDPQLAAVGLTENQAIAQGFDVSVARSRSTATSPTAGRWRTPPGSSSSSPSATAGCLLGAHIMGHQASSIIQPLIQAMSFGLTAPQMARGQYWIHPALPEVVENACWACADLSAARPTRLLASRAQATQRQAGPLRQRERTTRHRVLERRAQLPRGHFDDRAALRAHRVVVRGGGQPVGGDTAVEGQGVQHRPARPGWSPCGRWSPRRAAARQ